MPTFRSLHNVDISTKQVTKMVIPKDFSIFIDEFLSFAETTENTKGYTIRDITTQVATCISHIFRYALSDQITEEYQYEMSAKATSIANRLFNSEYDAQERIKQMHKRIKKGSLVQALVQDKTGSDSYLYIIAKVEHSEYINGEDFKKHFGFTSEKKNVWKYAVFPLRFSDDDVVFGSVRVYTENEASYWSKEFLELDEEKADDVNTKRAFDAVDRFLAKKIKKDSPRDYYILRNTVIKALRTPQLINYTEFVSQLIDNYMPENNKVHIPSLKEGLLLLPDKEDFDTQFHTIPRAVTARIKTKFKTMDGITIHIDKEIEDYKNVIVAGYDEENHRILKVRCYDVDTYKAFGGK